ncbi:MAG: RHS repeat-associated core domain-containing protein [Pyrinomonadaceae bacterium]
MTQNLLKLNYGYGTLTQNNGSVMSQTITVPTAGVNPGFTATQTYGYDSLNRIKQATETIGTAQTWKQTFTFDRYGNRRFDTANTTTLAPGCAETVCNPQIDPATNKLIGYQFDGSGNTKTDANGQTFSYDSENKQVQVNNASGVVGQYFYDGDGKRIKKVVPSTGETTIFVYDAAGKLVAEYSTIVASPSEAKVAYLTNDHLGSPRTTTDQFGQIISRRDFMPFGEEIARTNYGSDSVRQKFTGYERDIESELDFAQTRYYNPAHGRFTTTDALMASGRTGNPQTWNRYNYVGNNPLVVTDPTGEDWIRSNERDENGQYTYHDVYGKELREYLTGGEYSRIDFCGADSSIIERNGVAIYEMFAKGGGQEINTPSGPDAISALVGSVAENAETKAKTVALAAAIGVAVSTSAGVVMAATGAAVETGITVLGLTEAGAGTLGAAAASNPEKTLQTVTQLSNTVLNSFYRFMSKVPANARSNASLDILRNGGYRFTATSAGNVPGSRAIYERSWMQGGRQLDISKRR